METNSNATEQEVEEIEVTDENEDLEEESFEEENIDTNSNNQFDNSNLRKRLIKTMAIIFGAIIIIFLILWIISLFRTKNYSYEQVEQEMKKAAIAYFKDNSNKLPKKNERVEISTTVLANKEYMKSLNEYLGDDKDCSGKVSVKKLDNKYIYTPYLNCGSAYHSEELYKVVSKNLVSSGTGLYRVNNDYVYKGEKVKNYVKLDHSIWRILKITSDHKVMLVLDSQYAQPYEWDDRYNVSSEYNSGINDYKASRIREHLKEIYKDNDEYSYILTPSDKSKLTQFDLCIGKRSTNSTSKDNSEECSEILGNQKIGLLTVSDYINASLDINCNATLDYACQNYNYLNNDNDGYALVTAVSDSNENVYYVEGGIINAERAMTYFAIRPVVALSESTMLKSGKGTMKNPYKLK